MNVPPPEKCNLKIIISSPDSERLQRIAASHPFTEQLDIVFPSNHALEHSLVQLRSSYGKGKVRLSDIFSNASTFINSVEYHSDILLLSSSENEDDAWCLDPRGVLTISVSKGTYERAGLPGKKLPFKNHRDLYVIHLPLHKGAETSTNWAKRKAALEAWDARREKEGLGPWNVVYCSRDPGINISLPFQLNQPIVKTIEARTTQSADICIPSITIAPRPKSGNDLDDWNGTMSDLFEWIGMANLGSQRLKANDRVDPFVAVYQTPSPSRIGDLSHIQWRGLLSPKFVQSAIDAVISTMKEMNDKSGSFASVTSRALSESPLSYIPPAVLAAGAKAGVDSLPVQVPRSNGEDTWCAVLTPANDEEGISWAIVESLGQWDTRWG